MIQDQDSQLVRAAGKIAINRVGIPAVGWPAMTMGFSVKPELLGEAAVGNKVEFDVTVNDNGGAARVRARLQQGKPDRPKLLAKPEVSPDAITLIHSSI